MDWLDTYSDPSVKAASVVTNLWIAAFAICSACFALLGAVVALQWPNPRILCYKTSYSDMPSNSLRSCCSLYSLNLGFTVFWLLVFAIMVIARDVVRIVVCLAFCLVHVAVVVVFRMKFKRYGRPERPYNPSTEMVVASSAAGTTSLAPGQAVGIPVYNIPMQTVVIGGGGDAGGGGSGGAAQQQQQPWYAGDANCVPPQAQHMGPYPSSPAAGGAAGSFAVPAGPFPPQPAGPYPPQQPPQQQQPPVSGPTGGYVVGQPVTGLPVGAPGAGPAAAAAAAAHPGGAAPRASTDAGAAAGAAAAAGAGAAPGARPA